MKKRRYTKRYLRELLKFHPDLKLIDMGGDVGAGYYKIVWQNANTLDFTDLSGTRSVPELCKWLEGYSEGYFRGYRLGLKHGEKRAISKEEGGSKC